MTEQQILAKIDKWDEDDHVQAIVDFIEKLPHQHKTTAVLSELGRAYNNLYWLDNTEKNQEYLRKAIEVFKYLEEEIGDTESWNYRIGYSYYHLNDIPQAKKHLEQALSLSGTQELLYYIKVAEEKGISPKEVEEGGIGGVEFILEDFVESVKNVAPHMAERLGKPVATQEIEALEQRLGFSLPDTFHQLHKTFSGQTENAPFVFPVQYFVSLSEIEKYQQEILDFVEENFGKDWQKIQMSEENFVDEGEIKNQLFSRKWIPFMVQKEGDRVESYLCFDYDNDEDGIYGQLIGVTPNKNIEEYEVSYVLNGLSSWLSSCINGLHSEGMVYSEENNAFEFVDKGQFAPSYYTEEERETLESYINTHFGKFENVFHELVSPDIHCDIYVIEPTAERNYYTLVTGGMGAYDMNIPENFVSSPNAELMIHLPPTWNVKSEDEKDYWPIRWLKILSRLPIEQNTFLGWGHTIPTGEPLEGTNFSCLLLIATDDNTKEKDAEVTLPTGKKVQFYTLVPLYEQEMLYKLENDSGALLELFSENEIPYPPVVDVQRKNVCENFEPIQNTNVLDSIGWAFTQEYFPGLMIFWDNVQNYNRDLGNDLSNFNPFSTVFRTGKVKIMYEAWIKSRKDLLEYEILANENIFEEEPDEDGLYQAIIVAELLSGDNSSFGAIELLWMIHNTLASKELGDHIFFEGFDIEGYEEDGTPLLFINCGS
ncbi:MAG: suppressor of fused domain protein [Capnocytophaga sp.]|nr:suppressor of fused domain protein [Capnocytophaga sp.]